MSTDAATDPGTPEVLGRYRVERKLRGGAMGDVYLGVDPMIGRRVVLKTVRRALLVQDERATEFLDRFRRECRILGSLTHPNIVTMFDAGEDPATGSLYLAMEHVEGADLNAIIARGTRFPPEQVREIARALASALAEAHAHGVVHRDVKPANVLLAIDGQVKLTDFGIAKDAVDDDITRQGVVVGTPSYLSPEQVRGEPLDGRSDLYSLGVILFQLLAGRRPIEGADAAQVARRVAQSQAPPLLSVAPGVPRDLAVLVDRLLVKPREGRPASADDVLRMIDDAATDELATRDEEISRTARIPAVPDPAVTRPADRRPAGDGGGSARRPGVAGRVVVAGAAATFLALTLWGLLGVMRGLSPELLEGPRTPARSSPRGATGTGS